jgi:hypothetical protein
VIGLLAGVGAAVKMQADKMGGTVSALHSVTSISKPSTVTAAVNIL